MAWSTSNVGSNSPDTRAGIEILPYIENVAVICHFFFLCIVDTIGLFSHAKPCTASIFQTYNNVGWKQGRISKCLVVLTVPFPLFGML